MSEPAPKSTWVIPATAVQLPDGSTLVKPGKAVQRATAAHTAKITGVPQWTLSALADCGLITREQPSPKKFNYFPAEVEAFLKRTIEEPGFWNEVRIKAFLKGESLLKSKRR